MVMSKEKELAGIEIEEGKTAEDLLLVGEECLAEGKFEEAIENYLYKSIQKDKHPCICLIN
ncbi:MAG: hypothetical protein JJE19_00635, partial [Methanosarcinales archaeon]|nr:hypothetical protein [Methanosarcinales archaeon]